jgi:hypothetical protein
MNKFNLIVAEGHWDNHSNHTVKSLFDLLSDLLKLNAHAYKYVQFADLAGFDSCLKRIKDEDTHKYLYIGSHGDADGIYGSEVKSKLSYTAIKNRVNAFQGLYLGTCEFGTPARLTDFVTETDLTWCAGYKNSVDWLDSSALDMAFWKIFQRYNTQRGARSEQTLIEKTIVELKSKYSSLILDLGFNVAITRKDDDGDLIVEMAF